MHENIQISLHFLWRRVHVCLHRCGSLWPQTSVGSFGCGWFLEEFGAADCPWVTHLASILTRATAVQRKKRSSWEITDGAGVWSKEGDKRRQERGKERETESSFEQVGSGREIWGKDTEVRSRLRDWAESNMRKCRELSVCRDLLCLWALEISTELISVMLVVNNRVFFPPMILGNRGSNIPEIYSDINIKASQLGNNALLSELSNLYQVVQLLLASATTKMWMFKQTATLLVLF